MHLRLRVSGLLVVAIAAMTFAATLLFTVPAFAADSSTPQISVSDILGQLDQLQNMTVEEDVAFGPGNLAFPPRRFVAGSTVAWQWWG